jgi:hypothetical protein
MLLLLVVKAATQAGQPALERLAGHPTPPVVCTTFAYTTALALAAVFQQLLCFK